MRVTENTALGAACLVGLALSLRQDQGELNALWQTGRTFEPVVEAEERVERRRTWKRAIERSYDWDRPDQGWGEWSALSILL
ncbi:hypothetical protein DESA109040_04870 [Deinococcus saxicola]|uniref:hypothetical protein n=1 Tax=Deinococcus saxicola TaxID=249406 RepID=UPI0039EF14E4